MNIVWTYLATGPLLIAAVSLVGGGAAATAELRFVDAATRVMDANPSAGADALATPETAIASRD